MTLADVILESLRARFVGKTIIPPDMSLPQTVTGVDVGPESDFLPTFIFHYSGGGSGVFYLDDKFEVIDEIPTPSL